MRGAFLVMGLMLVLAACAPRADSATDAATDAAADAIVLPVDTAAPPDETAPELPDEPIEAQTPPVDAAPILAPILADRARACARDGGRFVPRGGSDLYACVRATPDGGNRCARSTDCAGLCLARSGTCAPYVPLYGCHEVLMNNGARATQCLD